MNEPKLLCAWCHGVILSTEFMKEDMHSHCYTQSKHESLKIENDRLRLENEFLRDLLGIKPGELEIPRD